MVESELARAPFCALARVILYASTLSLVPEAFVTGRVVCFLRFLFVDALEISGVVDMSRSGCR